jgi:hypothetical protein
VAAQHAKASRDKKEAIDKEQSDKKKAEEDRIKKEQQE